MRRVIKRGGNTIGFSGGGLSTYNHAVVAQDGLLVRLLIAPSEQTAVPCLMASVPAARALLAGRRYKGVAVVDLVKRLGGES